VNTKYVSTGAYNPRADDWLGPGAAVGFWALPGAPLERVTTLDTPALGGGLVELSFVSMYASLRGLLRQVMIGLSVNFGVVASA
jgi:hypothetical protein